jgi:PAS domain S-box-containing protein
LAKSQPYSKGIKGETYWDTYAVPIKNKSGDILNFIQVSRNITERKRAEEVLRESEEFSSSLLDNSPNPILVINPDTSARYVNHAFEELTGFSSAEVIGGKAPYPWWTEETLKKTNRDLKEAMRKGARQLEKLFQKKNGERFSVEITSTPVKSKGEFLYYLANWVDITERKRAEEALRESEQKFGNLADNSPSMIFVNQGGKVVYTNQVCQDLMGYTIEEFLSPDFDFLSLIAPESLELMANQLYLGL